MKIFIINRHKDDILGGSEIQCDIIARNLTKMGVEVIYVAMQSNHDFKLPYKVIPMTKYSPKEFGSFLFRHRPDVVYWRWNKTNLLSALRTTHKYEIKFVFSLSHVNDVSKYRWHWEPKWRLPIYSAKTFLYSIKQSVLGYWNYQSFGEMDGVVCQLNSYFEKLPKRFNASNSILIRNSIDFQLGTNFLWPRPYVVWVANLKGPKRPELYIRLAKALEGENVDFIMIGKIQDSAYNYVNDSSRLPTNLHYLGKKSTQEVNAILFNSLLMVHTCMPEGFPNNFIQAWSAGKPTITFSYDPDGIIEKFEIGFVSRDFEHFVEQTRTLIYNPELRNGMGQRAKAMAEKSFDAEINTTKLYSFLKNLCQENKIKEITR
ncbi:MAG: glycosyltransferase family 4 protein [Bacteroidaceae bacterium]|nr:glycosyltransferase family 4 protein [Bacteroidaceae bacterium]